VLFDVVEWMWSLDGELKDAYPKLRSLHERVGELPEIKAYVPRKDGDKPSSTAHLHRPSCARVGVVVCFLDLPVRVGGTECGGVRVVFIL